MRGGRVSADARARLLASDDPDHRRAARLLQAIAGEQPADSLAPVDEPSVEEPIEDVVEPVDIVEQPTPAPAPVPAPVPAPALVIVDDETIDPPPKLSRLPRDGVVHQWFAGMVVVEPEPESESETELDLFDPERLFGPELLLLRERPPLPPSRSLAGDGPGLVILTRVSLRDGPDPGTVELELAGAGPAIVHVQPLDSHRVRLWVVDAGAVPSLLAARPRHAAVEVVDIARRERVVELELRLAAGWSPTGITRRDNGAAVRFSSLDTLPP